MDLMNDNNLQDGDHRKHRIGGNDIESNKEEIFPSYDFQPIRPNATVSLSHSALDLAGSVNSMAARPWAASEPKLVSASSARSYGSLDSLEPSKLLGEKDQSALESAIISEIDQTMKKHADNLLHAMEGVSARLTQLETRNRTLENLVDNLKVSVGNSHGSTDGKMRQLENILLEVQSGVELLKDKQEIVEAQLQLSKFQASKVNPQPEIHSTHVEPTTQPSASLPLPNITQQPPLAAAPPSVPQQSLPPPSSQQYILPPPSQHSLPPPSSQLSQHSNQFSPQQEAYFPPSGQSQPPPPPPPPPLANQPPYQAPPPAQSLQPPHQPPYQSPPQQPRYPQQPPPQIQQLPSGYNPEEPPYPLQSYSSNPPRQPPSHSAPDTTAPSQHYYNAPPPPPSMYDGSGGRSNAGFLSGYSSEPYPYTGPPQFGNTPSVKTRQQSGSGTGYPQLPMAHALPQALPMASAVSSGGRGDSSSPRAESRVPVDDVIDKVSSMGFPRDQVRGTVRTLTENGQAVDLNVVLDKLMNGGRGALMQQQQQQQQPPRGWYGGR